jgi:tRNA(Ile)-lysidine synthase
MPRSHPPTLLTLAHRLVRDERLFTRGDRVLCACSGGTDSQALLHALALLRARIGHELCAVGVDHGLRPEAAAELDRARALAAAHGVPFRAVRVGLAAGPNLQARARAARHHALGLAAQEAGARVIALGHTADDRAETLLLRLLRGAGPAGLGVMPARSAAPVEPGVPLVRPLIAARRSDVTAHLARHRVPFAIDPSNADRRFLRVRVRLELLPLLESLSPGIVPHLCALADMLRAVAAPVSGLGRAHRRALERAGRLGRPSLRLRLEGGRDVDVDVRTVLAALGRAGPP